MTRRSDDVRLRHMLGAAEKAVGFCKGKTRDDLDRDELFSLALVRLLEVIGEAARSVSSEKRKTLDGIPWRAIIGARDRLIHSYLDVDFDIVCQIASTHLPVLVEALRRALPANG